MERYAETAGPCPSSASAPAASVLALAGEVRRHIALARAMTLAGRRVSLAGLESAVGLLCAKALDLPPQEAPLVRAQLVLLGVELDRFAAAIEPNRAGLPGVLHN